MQQPLSLLQLGPSQKYKINKKINFKPTQHTSCTALSLTLAAILINAQRESNNPKKL
jgi:hypothetical protein